MSEDRLRPGQRIAPRYPGTGGDVVPDDVEGHRLDEAPEGAGPLEGAPARDDDEGEDDVEGHRISQGTDTDGAGPTDALRTPSSGRGEFIAKLPPDSPHREG